MEKRAFKDSIYSEIASLTKSLSNPHRIEILDLLSNGEKSVEQIAQETALSFANASQHLQHLKKVRLVKIRREKNFVYYNLGNPYVYAVWKTLREFSRYHNPEINQLISNFQNSHKTTSITAKQLDDHIPYTLLDVRPEEEYNIRHIEGAIHITPKELQSQIHSLDKNKTIITYCRGPFCTLAVDAATILQDNGFKAIRLEESALDV
jgi:rhodanese-related sulfurtransferase